MHRLLKTLIKHFRFALIADQHKNNAPLKYDTNHE